MTSLCTKGVKNILLEVFWIYVARWDLFLIHHEIRRTLMTSQLPNFWWFFAAGSLEKDIKNGAVPSRHGKDTWLVLDYKLVSILEFLCSVRKQAATQHWTHCGLSRPISFIMHFPFPLKKLHHFLMIIAYWTVTIVESGKVFSLKGKVFQQLRIWWQALLLFFLSQNSNIASASFIQ